MILQVKSFPATTFAKTDRLANEWLLAHHDSIVVEQIAVALDTPIKAITVVYRDLEMEEHVDEAADILDLRETQLDAIDKPF